MRVVASGFSPDIIQQLARQLMAAAQCYVSRKDNTVFTFPADESLIDVLEAGQAAKMKKELKKIRSQESLYIHLTPPSGYQIFSMMEDFLRTVKDPLLREQLRRTLGLTKPIPLFREVIENSAYATTWQQFREKRYLEWAEKQIRLQSFPDADDIMQMMEK